MSDINVVVCVYNRDFISIKRKVLSFFQSFNCNINVLLCYTGIQEINPIINQVEKLRNAEISFQIVKVKNSLMDIGAYVAGYNTLENKDNLTIFMNDRFLAEFNIKLFSNFLLRDLSTLNSLTSPTLYGKVSHHAGLVQSSTVSDINFFIPTYFFAINYQSAEIFRDWAYEIEKIETMDSTQLEYFLLQQYSRQIFDMSFEICMNKNSKYFWTNNYKYKSDSQILKKKMKCVISEQLLTEIFKNRSLIFSINDTILRKLMTRVLHRKIWVK